ncbi:MULTISPECIES: pectinesterase family protein [Chitinophagaceae]
MYQLANNKLFKGLPFLIVFCFYFSGWASNAFAQKTNYSNKFVVAEDGSGDFRTIQEAINAVRDLSQQRVVIHIKSGVYKEKLVIPEQKTNITLDGEDKEHTIIVNDDFSGKPYSGKDERGLDKYTTYTSYTVLVLGNDFIAQNLTIENSAGRVGQAVALNIAADRAQIINCNLKGDQDTLYAAKGRQYYKSCHIEGTTDFIFGKAVAIFEGCTIMSKQNSYITAAATDSVNKFGFVFFHCKLEAKANVDKVFLGRPWRPYAKTVFIDCEMGGHIRPEGWDNWRDTANEKTAYYGEYRNIGPGALSDKRVTWSHQLSNTERKRYTITNIFQTSFVWNPSRAN